MTNQESMRATALQMAIQCQKTGDTPADIVARAEAFYAFLLKREPVR